MRSLSKKIINLYAPFIIKLLETFGTPTNLKLWINLQLNPNNFKQIKYFFQVKPRSIYVFVVLPTTNSAISSSQRE